MRGATLSAKLLLLNDRIKIYENHDLFLLELARLDDFDRFRHFEQQDAARVGADGVKIVRRRVKIIACAQMVFAEMDVALENENFFARRVIVQRVFRAGFKFQKNRRRGLPLRRKAKI